MELCSLLKFFSIFTIIIYIVFYSDFIMRRSGKIQNQVQAMDGWSEYGNFISILNQM